MKRGVGGGGVVVTCLHTQSSMSASSEVAPWQAHAASARMLACEHTQTHTSGSVSPPDTPGYRRGFLALTFCFVMY